MAKLRTDVPRQSTWDYGAAHARFHDHAIALGLPHEIV
jgi:hypothetical protein